jgi:hypothetical protein
VRLEPIVQLPHPTQALEPAGKMGRRRFARLHHIDSTGIRLAGRYSLLTTDDRSVRKSRFLAVMLFPRAARLVLLC